MTAVQGAEVLEVEDRSEGIPAPPHPVYQVVRPHRPPVLDPLQPGRVVYEDGVTVAAGLPSELLGTVAGGVPAVDGCNEDVRLREELAQLQQDRPRLLTLSVPGGVEHEQGVLELSSVLKGLEHISLVIVLHMTAYYERSRSEGGSYLWLVRVVDDPEDGGDDEGDEHDVTDNPPADHGQAASLTDTSATTGGI